MRRGTTSQVGAARRSATLLQALFVVPRVFPCARDIASKLRDKHGASMGFKSVDEMGEYVDSVMGAGCGTLGEDGSRFWVDHANSVIIFRGPNEGVPGSVSRPDNFARAVAGPFEGRCQNRDAQVPS